ncbi:MAG: hypothetical protein HQL41_11960 [Alphaproteobacteria bacterium]|nr:hypothetical protein [Alphaproteobacteria bacterium]
MAGKFNAKPPLPVWKDETWRNKAWKDLLKRTVIGVTTIFTRVFIPYSACAQEPNDLPETASDPDELQLDQCQTIYNEVEDRRAHLEKKAHSMFTVIIFMIPLIGSIFVFVYKESFPDVISRTITIALLAFSGAMLVLGFISVMRAVSIKTRDILLIDSVVDPETGHFRRYSKAFHAQGLLYCAAKNTAMNDHIAQFVKGAQALTGMAAIATLAAAIPAAIVFSNHPSSPAKTQVIGPVDLASPELAGIRKDISGLKAIAEAMARAQTGTEGFRLIDERLTKIEDKLWRIEKQLWCKDDPGLR